MSGECPARLPTCPRRWAERATAGEGPTACLGRRPGLTVSTKTPANGKAESPSTVRPLTGARLCLAKSGRRLEFKLYLALAPSRHGKPSANPERIVLVVVLVIVIETSHVEDEDEDDDEDDPQSGSAESIRGM